MLLEDAHAVDAPFRDLRFVTISSITLWVIWKVRCSQILSAHLPVLPILCRRYGQSCYIPFVATGIYQEAPHGQLRSDVEDF